MVYVQDEVCEVSSPGRLVTAPLVSVLMITYNHEGYLADAIEGVVSQDCDFPFELIIGEDASNDATREIALEYQKRYPEIIRVVFSAENVGMNVNSRRIFSLARGDYVAYCEGDDLWCATDKLSRQVALMERDRDIGIVHSDWTRSRLKDGEWAYDFRKSVHRRVALRYLNGNIFKTWHYPKVLRTCTILLRRSTMLEWYESGIMDEKYRFGDSVLSAWVTSRWQVGYIPAVTAVYRVSPNSALRSGAKARVDFYRSALEFDAAARTFFANSHDYPAGYRWEATAGLLLWAVRAWDISAINEALLEFKRGFTVGQFMKEGMQAFLMRLPTLRRQEREAPDSVSFRPARS